MVYGLRIAQLIEQELFNQSRIADYFKKILSCENGLQWDHKLTAAVLTEKDLAEEEPGCHDDPNRERLVQAEFGVLDYH